MIIKKFFQKYSSYLIRIGAFLRYDYVIEKNNQRANKNLNLELVACGLGKKVSRIIYLKTKNYL